MAVGIALVLTALSLSSLLGVFHDPLAWIPGRYPIKEAFTQLDEHVGGTASIALLIDPKGGSLVDRDLMLGLAALETHVHRYRDPVSGDAIVGNSTGVLDVVRESHRALRGGAPEQYKVPDSARGVTDMFTLFENSGPDELKRLATVDMARGLMTLRVKWLDAGSYGPLTEHVRRGVEAHISKLADVIFTGAVFTQFSVMSHLLADLIRSFGVALVVITVVMVLLLRELKLGLIAMVPNLMPIICVMGFMGAAGIAVDGANLMLASIAIGVAVDDTIHFLHQFRSHYRHHGRVESAIEHAFDHTGRAIITTSIILVGGFIVFVTSEMANIRDFGLLISLAIVLALVINLLFCPVLLRTFYRDFAVREPGA